MFYKISYFIFEYTNSTLQVTAVFAKFLHSISYICCQHGILDTRLALSYVVRDEGGGGGGGLTTSRNKSAIGGRNLFVDGPLLITRYSLLGIQTPFISSSSC